MSSLLLVACVRWMLNWQVRRLFRNYNNGLSRRHDPTKSLESSKPAIFVSHVNLVVLVQINFSVGYQAAKQRDHALKYHRNILDVFAP